MAVNSTGFGIRQVFSRGRTRRLGGPASNALHLRLEPLEPRYLLSGMSGSTFLEVPAAADNHYLTHEDLPVSRNMITDDTGISWFS